MLAIILAHLSIIIQHTQQMNTVNDARLMKLPRDPEQLLELLLAQMVQHTRIHHVGGETLRVLGQTEIRQPLGTDPSMTKLGDAGIPNVARMPMFLDGQTQLLPMKRMRYT